MDAIAVITARLGGSLYSTYAERFLFAISVHSMESWLLLCLFDRNEPKNSMNRLNRQLRKAGQDPLAKGIRAYQRIARTIKRKQLMVLSVKNNSLGLFLAQLGALGAAGVEEA